MQNFNQFVFSSLLADDQFVRWAKGEPCTNPEYWANWKTQYPEICREFDDAAKVASALSFASPSISDQEIAYMWQNGVLRKNQDRNRKKIAPSVLLMRIAAAFFLPLLLSTAVLYFSQSRLQKQYSAFVAGQSGKNIAVQAPIGTRTVVDLPDGSKVWLNSGSRLTYPASFADNQREVRLEGEAFFDIEKESKPFLVQNSGPTVKVYGTRFNVNDYADEDHVVVALEEGSVALEKDGEERFLVPGEVSVYNRENQKLSIQHQNLEPFLSWREGKLIFRNTHLDEIVRVLQRQYNVVFEFEDPTLASYQYNATFGNESLEQILQLLKVSAPQMQFEYTKAYLTEDGEQVKGKVLVKRKRI